MTKPAPEKRIRFCDECDCEREAEVLERKARYNFRKEPFDIIERCVRCMLWGNEVYDEELDTETLKKLARKYEDKYGINAETIKAIRQRIGFPPSVFAELLQASCATLERYERGGALPSREQMEWLHILKHKYKVPYIAGEHKPHGQ